MLTEKFHSLSTFQKLKLKILLKCADVELSDLMDHQGIENVASHNVADSDVRTAFQGG